MVDKEREDRGNTLLIKNLYLAGLLHAKGLRLLDVQRERPNSRILWFNFDNRQEAEQLLSKHWNGEVTVNLRDYLSSLDTLRDIIFGRARGERDENGEKGLHQT